MQVHKLIIRRGPLTIEEAVQIAMSVTTILAFIMCESSHEAMEVDNHS